MASDEYGDKTEQPTDRRRSEAREKGNVARSTDLSAAGLMMAVTLVLFVLGRPLAKSLASVLQSYLSGPAWITLDKNIALAHFKLLTETAATDLLPLMLSLMAAAFFFNFVQVGFLLTPEALMPSLARLNPLEGFKRIISQRALARLLGSLLKLVVVITIAAWSIAAFIPLFLPMTSADVAQILVGIEQSVVKLAFQLALALMILAVLDFGFQKWKFEQDLRMTKEEVREEMKNMDGDPHIRQRRREAHRKLAQAREMQQVRHADVVITNPTHIAVALKYDPADMPAPRVIAKGMGAIAERIRQIAVEQGIPIIERKELARSLYREVKVGRYIPAEMYEVFVEIMAYVYRITGKVPSGLV